jgi:hypothetical protein
MKMNKLILAIALAVSAGSTYAGFVDNRAADGVVEVNYKSIAVEDLVADIVPAEYQTDYAKPLQRKTLVSITGKGTWYMLLTDALARSSLPVYINQAGHRVTVGERTTPAERSPQTTAALVAAPTAAAAVAVKASALPATAAVKPVLLPVATPAPAAYTTTSADYQVSAVLQRWAAQANMQYIWEPRNVEFQISAENDWGTDLERAVRDLLTSVQSNQAARAGRDRVRACIHPNRPRQVLRIIRFEERCEGAM